MKAEYNEAKHTLQFKSVLMLAGLFMIFVYCKSAYDYNNLQSEYHNYIERTDSQLNEMNETIEQLSALQKKVDFVNKETECLAKNIYFEAGSEPVEGKLAVAQVTRNRVKSGKFASTYCGVIYQRVKDKCQFSWTCDGRSDKIKAPSLYKGAMKIAQDFLLRNKKSAIIGKDVYFYHANYVQPKWSDELSPVTTIGSHVFYKYGN